MLLGLINTKKGVNMFKLLFVTLFLIAGNSAFAGGEISYLCKIEGVNLNIDGYSVYSAQLSISMSAKLSVVVNNNEAENSINPVSSKCFNAFQNNEWNRFICIVGNQAVIVTTDETANTCLIKPVSSMN